MGRIPKVMAEGGIYGKDFYPPLPTPKSTFWLKLVEIIQFMWDNGSISTELGWKVLVLIPKVNTDNRGIGLAEVVWKVVEAVIDTCIKTVVKFHDVLHGFRAGWGGRGPQ